MTSNELLQLAQQLNERDEPYAMVTVVRVAAPTSAYVGAQAIVQRDGTLSGWIGGGCAKDVVIAAAREAIDADLPKLLRIANDDGPLEPGIEHRDLLAAFEQRVCARDARRAGTDHENHSVRRA